MGSELGPSAGVPAVVADDVQALLVLGGVEHLVRVGVGVRVRLRVGVRVRVRG